MSELTKTSIRGVSHFEIAEMKPSPNPQRKLLGKKSLWRIRGVTERGDENDYSVTRQVWSRVTGQSLGGPTHAPRHSGYHVMRDTTFVLCARKPTDTERGDPGEGILLGENRLVVAIHRIARTGRKNRATDPADQLGADTVTVDVDMASGELHVKKYPLNAKTKTLTQLVTWLESKDALSVGMTYQLPSGGTLTISDISGKTIQVSVAIASGTSRTTLSDVQRERVAEVDAEEEEEPVGT